MNKTLKAIKSRKSVRVFTDEMISDEIKDEILNASIQAPTAGNQVMYTIIDVVSQEKKDRLAESCDHQPFIKDAPLVLVYAADCRRYLEIYKAVGIEARLPGEGDLFLACQDALVAAQNAVVAAESFGIGSCYIGDIIENYEEQRDILDLPDYVFPAGMLVFGYPTKQQQERKKPNRFAKEHIVHQDSYRVLEKDEIIEMFEDRHFDEPSFDFNDFVTKFHDRKYASDFSQEMTRSVRKYLKQYEELDVSHIQPEKF